MTVCIAAICNSSYIVGAADREITYGDTKYEQAEPKILQLATNTVALTSGSPEAHIAIRSRVLGRILTMTAPTVEMIAEAYAQEFGDLRRRHAERKHLTPLGLTTWSFLNNQTNLTASVAQTLIDRMANEDLGCQTIIAGVDQLGPHIFVVDDPGDLACFDADGWAAIGSGWRHADQQFIRDKYHRDWPFDEAFLLTYLAKKKADVTPGVGVSTDMFWIGAGAASPYLLLPRDAPIVEFVERLHDDIERKEKELGENARQEVRSFLASLVQDQESPGEQEQIDEFAQESPPRADDSHRAQRKSTKRQPTQTMTLGRRRNPDVRRGKSPKQERDGIH